MWVYIKTEANLWTVGFYNPDKKFQTDSDYDNKEEAVKRVAYLNGGKAEIVHDIATCGDSIMRPRKYNKEPVPKCINCNSTELIAVCDDLTCSDCNTSMMYATNEYSSWKLEEIEPQVLLRLKNTDRTDILFALRLRHKGLNESSKILSQKLIDYIDRAGSK